MLPTSPGAAGSNLPSETSPTPSSLGLMTRTFQPGIGKPAGPTLIGSLS